MYQVPTVADMGDRRIWRTNVPRSLVRRTRGIAW
jgi:hypothetical protein